MFLGGVINYLLTNDKIQHEYVKNYTDFPFIVREDFAFNDGLYSGYNADKRSYDKIELGLRARRRRLREGRSHAAASALRL